MTWSIVAHDPATGAFAVAIATRAFAEDFADLNIRVDDHSEPLGETWPLACHLAPAMARAGRLGAEQGQSLGLHRSRHHPRPPGRRKVSSFAFAASECVALRHAGDLDPV